MQCVSLPKKMHKQLSSLCSNFLWNEKEKKRGIHLINDELLFTPVAKGGLGVRDSFTLNKVLQVKMCWKLHSQSNLASQVIAAKYCSHTIPTPFHKGSHFWKFVGEGSQILFWEDDWSGLGALRKLVQGPLDESNQNIYLSSVMSNQSWCLSTPSNLLPVDVCQIISQLPIPTSGSDFPFYSLTKGPKFDSKSTYSSIWASNHPISLPEATWIWKLSVAPKVQFFLWLCWLDTIPSKHMLATKFPSLSAASVSNPFLQNPL